jgi:DNA-binding transcriptional LysR family regulator
MMDLAGLRSFLAVAETLHFSRAAARLHVSQPTLSQQVRRLEERLGLPLFERTSRRVRLTNAGQALVVGARRVLADLEQAERHCRDAAAGEAGQLTVAAIGAALNSIAPPVIAELRHRVPGVAVHLRQMDTASQLIALRDGSLDVGVVRSAASTPGLEIEALIEEPMAVAVPDGHPLAGVAVIELEQLRLEDFVLWPRPHSAGFHDQVFAACQQAGFTPRVVMEGADTETQLGLVSAGIGVSIQPASYALLAREGLVWLRLPDHAPRSQLQIVRPSAVSNPATATFVEIATTFTRRHGPVLRVGPYA